MKEIATIYCNDFGMTFFWKKDEIFSAQKIQLIFKETGFYLTQNQLSEFGKIICETESKLNGCKGCAHQQHCERLLLKTPISEVDLAVSKNELSQIKDLVEGSIFRVELKRFVMNEGQN